MNILIIDALGGGAGKQLVALIRERFPNLELHAVGTNSIAANAMLKAGATYAATGENAVIVGCRKADIIIGPVGIVIADALHGEITPAMALAVAQSNAKRILIPFNQCDTIVAGITNTSMSRLLQSAVDELTIILEKGKKNI